MGFMKKIAVGRQTGGFMQTRRGTRPLRVDTLLNRETSVPDSHKDFWVETPSEESDAHDIFAEGLARTEGEEFGAENEPKIDPILSRIAKESSQQVVHPKAEELRKQLRKIQKRVGYKQPEMLNDEWMYEG